MARFDVFRLDHEEFLLLDLQSALYDVLKTRVVAPLIPASNMSWSIERLHPRFEIEEVVYVLATNRLAAVDQRDLGALVTNLAADADRIIAATDFLFQGF
jgi:toxin CcdB